MPKPQIEAETARLEARVPVQVYDQMQRAARLRGMTLTGYLLATAGEEALTRFGSAYLSMASIIRPNCAIISGTSFSNVRMKLLVRDRYSFASFPD